MKSIEYYLEKGFDRRSAAPGADFTVLLQFDNGERRSLDRKPSIRPGTVFAFLADPAIFCRVYLDENRCVSWDIDPNVDSGAVWSNKVDLSPDTCYLDSIPVP